MEGSECSCSRSSQRGDSCEADVEGSGCRATEGDIAYGVGSRGDRVEGAADGVAEILVRRTRRLLVVRYGTLSV